MSELRVPGPRQEFNFTEQPDWRLEDRYQHLSEQEAIGERKEQIVREMAHLLFELGARVQANEDVRV